MKVSKCKIAYQELPTFEEFVNKKRIKFMYSFMGQLMEMEIYVHYHSIVMDYSIYDNTSLGYSKEKLIQKIVYPLSTKGYKKVRAKLLKDQFSTNVASNLGVSKEEIHEVYSILNKIIEEENENDR